MRKLKSNVDVLDDSKFTSDFMKFVKTGGSWSLKTGKPIVEVR